MKILVIDGMGGGIGKLIIEKINAMRGAAAEDTEIIAVGTNAVAASVMLKAGADHAATGESAVVYNAKQADYIIGVVGIAFANSMHGEVSPKMAKAVSRSRARKLLIPMEKCSVTVMGVTPAPMQVYVNEAVQKIFNKI